MTKTENSNMTDEACERLIWAILRQSLFDWNKYAKQLKVKSKRYKAMQELKQIINFVLSDWYVYLTDASSDQELIAKGLIDKIEQESDRKELLDYMNAKINKPILIQESNEISQVR